MQLPPWKTQHRFVELRTPWLTLIGEYLADHQAQSLEYWRVEKADSAIVLPIHRQQILLPPPTYRPGVGEETWDFPGGRILENISPGAAAIAILQREMKLAEEAIASLKPLNATGWAVNSSFSNQYLYGFVAEIHPSVDIDPAFVGKKLPATESGIRELLDLLICVQCRAVLLAWWFERCGKDLNQ